MRDFTSDPSFLYLIFEWGAVTTNSGWLERPLSGSINRSIDGLVQATSRFLWPILCISAFLFPSLEHPLNEVSMLPPVGLRIQDLVLVGVHWRVRYYRRTAVVSQVKATERHRAGEVRPGEREFRDWQGESGSRKARSNDVCLALKEGPRRGWKIRVLARGWWVRDVKDHGCQIFSLSLSSNIFLPGVSLSLSTVSSYLAVCCFYCCLSLSLYSLILIFLSIPVLSS